MSHMSDLKCFGCYEEYSEILCVPIEHIWGSIWRRHTPNTVYNYCLRLAITYMYEADIITYQIKISNELSQRLLAIWYSRTVHFKGLNAYDPNSDTSCDLKYSTYKYYMTFVRNAFVNILSFKLLLLAIFCILCHIWVVWSAFRSIKSPQACY